MHETVARFCICISADIKVRICLLMVLAPIITLRTGLYSMISLINGESDVL